MTDSTGAPLVARLEALQQLWRGFTSNYDNEPSVALSEERAYEQCADALDPILALARQLQDNKDDESRVDGERLPAPTGATAKIATGDESPEHGECVESSIGRHEWRESDRFYGATICIHCGRRGRQEAASTSPVIPPCAPVEVPYRVVPNGEDSGQLKIQELESRLAPMSAEERDYSDQAIDAMNAGDYGGACNLWARKVDAVYRELAASEAARQQAEQEKQQLETVLTIECANATDQLRLRLQAEAEVSDLRAQIARRRWPQKSST